MGNVGAVDSDPADPLKFKLATTRTWKDRASGDTQSETEWHRITVWRPPPALVQRLAKGARVYVAGRVFGVMDPASQVEVLQAPRDPEPGPPPDQSWQARPAQDGDAYP